MKQKNLLYDSASYYEDNDYYEIFSIAEDYDGHVKDYLKSLGRYDVILDAGCGTGKYLNTLESISNKYIGIDLSSEQLAKAKNKITKNNSTLINANLTSIPLPDKSVDLIVSCWVLGTITDEITRKKALDELRRVLKDNGKIILVENDKDGEFETLRNHIKDGKTEKYNDWLKSNEFKEHLKIKTKFKFDNKDIAKNVFDKIYGKDISNKINSDIINHNISIYIGTKK